MMRFVKPFFGNEPPDLFLFFSKAVKKVSLTRFNSYVARSQRRLSPMTGVRVATQKTARHTNEQLFTDINTPSMARNRGSAVR
jgi:hypothetical protein